MKGIVFTEFLELVEDQFGLEVADHIIQASDLPSGGVYTSVGTYDHHELLQLVNHLSTAAQVAVPDLLRTFGEYLFGRFVVGYPRFFEGVQTTFHFLMQIDSHIHTEVRKLYPDAELPRFEYKRLAADHLELLYHSSRPLADFAEGLIRGCIKHFREQIELERVDLPNEHGTTARFLLTHTGRVSC
jgi:hypothetical protein